MKVELHLVTFEFTVYDETSILVQWERVHKKHHLITVWEEGDREGCKVCKVESYPNRTVSLQAAREFAKTIFD